MLWMGVDRLVWGDPSRLLRGGGVCTLRVTLLDKGGVCGRELDRELESSQ